MRTIFDFRISILDSRPGRWLARAITAAFLLAAPGVANAQGCAMCYQSASAANRAGIQALESGVLILLAPPLAMFAAILWRTFRGSTPWAIDEDSVRLSASGDFSETRESQGSNL